MIQLQLEVVEERTSKMEDGAAEMSSNSAETEPWKHEEYMIKSKKSGKCTVKPTE